MCSQRYPETYDACFGAEHQFRLFDRRGTFRLSSAGLAMGNYLADNLTAQELGGRVLDIGTGSGAIALLLRRMGARSITAVDICASAVATAMENEIENFGNSAINFQHADLFPDAPGSKSEPCDLITFNAPGWRAPSQILKAALKSGARSLDLNAMFYGDRVLLRFLQQLPGHMTENGRAIVGLNSLVGIGDIVNRSRSTHRPKCNSKLNMRLLKRVELPLLFYTKEWLEVRDSLLEFFEQGRDEYSARYVTEGDTIHWFYEITEVTVERPATTLHSIGDKQ